MATVASTNAGEVEVIEWGEQDTKVAAAAIVGGTFVREDTSGNWIQALGTSTANLKGARYALRSVAAGQALTAARTGVYGGLTISQAFNADLFISDTGTLADAAGTAGSAVARVIALTGNQVTAAHDKGIRLDLPL
jgi:hypothetical protein